MKFFLTLFFNLIFTSFLLSQEALSMTDAIQLALENVYQMEISRNELEIARNNNDWSIAGKYPTIDFDVQSNFRYNNVTNPASVVIETNASRVGVTPNLGVNFIAFDGFRIRFNKQQLEQLEDLSEGNLRLTIEQTIQDVMLAYYGTLAQQENLRVLRETLDLSRDRVDFDNLRREYGQAATFDVLQAQDAYLSDSTSYLLEVTNYENALRNLNLAMGLDDIDRRFNLTDTLVFEPLTTELSALENRMLANNVSLQNLFINRELAATNTSLQRSELYPTIGLGAGTSYDVGISYGSQTFNFGGDINEQEIPSVAAKTLNAFASVNLSYRITDFGGRKRRIESARLAEITAQLDVKDLQRALRTQLTNTYANYLNRIELFEVSQASLKNARQNLEIATERFRGGLINSFDFRIVQESYIRASQTRLLAVFNLKTVETDLLRLVGDLVLYGE